ncbi:MAG: glycosyltransferase family 2 protein [Candidatus Hodarchaeota archaeon]
MSVYNGEKAVSKAIESIINQTYKNFEFIIIDDGSKDNSLEIIKNYANKDKKIRVIRNRENLGLAKSLNKAIRLSSADYIARQDYDDISLPHRLEKQLKFLQENPLLAFCGCNVKLKEGDLNFIKFFEYEDIFKNQIIENCFAHSTIFIRREVFDLYGYYNEKLRHGQDFELWCRLIYKYKLKAGNIKEKLLILDSPVSIFNKKNKQKLIRQLINQIYTTLRYLKYARNKFGGIKEIIKLFTEIIYIKLII